MIDKKKFKNPDSFYRSAPFWALNDTLQHEELSKQITLFHEQGFGGVFLHPRGGMVTEYLSDDFFRAIESCVEKLKEIGMYAWLYDEDRFPSGNAGGKVVKTNQEFAKKCIVLRETNSDGIKEIKDILALYVLKNNGYERLSSPCSEDKILVVCMEEGHKRAVFDCESSVDVCNRDAVNSFVNITHEKYYSHFAKHFGDIIPAIFTDEPDFKPDTKGSLPWTKDLHDKFIEKYEYDLSDYLPSLFWDMGNYKKIRFDYWNLISSMFVYAFSKNIYDWCEDKSIAYTGHFWEHVFPSPLYTGSVMPQYEYMHYPGIDMLFVSDDKNKSQYGNDFIVKEASSVANQLCKKRVLSETHGGSGWGLDFKYQKRALDWQFALGINMFCMHLSLYSMKGYRKRDFPPSFSYHQPWWDDYKLLGDYTGRLSYALSQGKYQADVLVLHPSSSTWTGYGALSKNEVLTDISESVESIVKTLNSARIMFDLGDDTIISKYGRIADGLLNIGQMRYSVVIVPNMEVIRSKVFKILNEFSDMGGVIILTGQTPTLLDGIYSNELVNFFNDGRILKGSDIYRLLNPISVERLDLQEVNGGDIKNVYAHIRRQDNYKIIFVCNLDMNKKYNLRMNIDKPYFVEQFNAETGEGSRCEVYSDHTGNYYISFVLEPLNSTLFMIDEAIDSEVLKEFSLKEEKRGKMIKLADWEVEVLDPNAINLQFCRVSLDGGAYGEIGDVLKIDDELKDSLSMERGNIFVRQPWMYTEEEKNDLHIIRAEYPFYIEQIPKGRVMAAVESPDIFDVFINNIKVRACGDYYKDQAFVLYNIKDHMKAGENIIRIESKKYGLLVNLESIYIFGDFMLKNNMIKESEGLALGNLAEQGYPYYSGRVTYSSCVNIDCDFEKAVLDFDYFDGVCAKIIVNEKPVKTIGWNPYRVDLTSDLIHGLNIVTIEIANSLQNLLGPFGSNTNLKTVTPGSFYADEHMTFLPFGFNGKAEITII